MKETQTTFKSSSPTKRNTTSVRPKERPPESRLGDDSSGLTWIQETRLAGCGWWLEALKKYLADLAVGQNLAGSFFVGITTSLKGVQKGLRGYGVLTHSHLINREVKLSFPKGVGCERVGMAW